MKKLLLLLSASILTATSAFAQARAGGNLSSADYTTGRTHDSRNTGFGIKGGYNYSNFYGSGSDIFMNKDASNSFHAGVYGQLGFTDFSSLQVELLYSRKGVKTDMSSSGESLRLDYLELPILYVGNFTDNLSFHIGPQVSLVTKAKFGDQDVNIAEASLNTVDFGAIGGLEARVGPARVGARYDLSFGNTFKQDNDAVARPANFTDYSIHNQVFQVYVGIGLTQ